MHNREKLEIFETAAQKAMFRMRLKNILVLLSPSASSRLSHSFFCPAMRVVALDRRGQKIYDRVIRGWGIFKLPPAQMVLEMDPDMDYRRWLPDILSEAFSGSPG